jgi:hypothetical protein
LQHTMGMCQMCTKVWLEYLKEIDHFKELGKNGWIFQWILGKSGMHVQACARALTCVCVWCALSCNCFVDYSLRY